ncbi:hypothetical protein KORDIASMS9_01680 [Kordia sp. SMS9]|uniref:hypothetical protein n=1 Tax=Kordia sp. SMS9 TaxID=2282170 RepID=UPI000E0D3A3C|nr:hypothetical protein [Kordia sp. SMS9]AXG69458.1 hypothetical protein KORDIASMS9_01680 [Kordia sp. SMS9]
MKKRNLKSLQLKKVSISNFEIPKGGANQTGYAPCQFTPTSICDFFTNRDGWCKGNTYQSECDPC